jgi:CRISPR/Cas system CSM-associated protein Csm3 (group 7 of RAMP superfamily)
MARKINSRLRINGTLQAETPLHVGVYGVDVDTDLPLARNGKMPGTSITGVLRAWCERNFGNVNSILGFQEKDKSKVGTKDDKSQASFVLIKDAVVTLPNNLQTEIRDGVGIDRFYGTAAESTKYDRAILVKSLRREKMFHRIFDNYSIC